MGGKVFKGIGNAIKSVAPVALGVGGALLGGPAGAALGSSLGGLFGGGNGDGGWAGGLGQIGGGLYDFYNNRNIDKGKLEAILTSGQQASDLLNPYYQSGTKANQSLSDRLMQGFQFNQGDLYNDPGYQFALEQGQRGLGTQAAKSGLLGSGRALKEAASYNQGMAEGQFNNVYNRNLENWKAQNAGLQNLSTAGQLAAGSMGDLMVGMGANRAAYRASMGANRGNLVGNLTKGAAPLLGGIGSWLETQDQNMEQERLRQENPNMGALGSYFGNKATTRLRNANMGGFGNYFANRGRSGLTKGSGGSNWKVLR